MILWSRGPTTAFCHIFLSLVACSLRELKWKKGIIKASEKIKRNMRRRREERFSWNQCFALEGVEDEDGVESDV